MSEPAETLPVVVGVDGSPDALRAVEWAADDAVRRGRPLRLVHATVRWMYDIPIHPLREDGDELEQHAAQILDEAAKAATARQPGVTVEKANVFADPAVALREESERAFELVVGTRGLGGFARMLLGSVSAKLAAHAACPVVVLHGDSTVAHGRIVVGVDGSPASTTVLAYAFEAAALWNARLTAVRAWNVPGAALPGETLSPVTYSLEELADVAHKNLTECLADFKKRYPDIAVTEEVVRAHPADALVEASKTADLVVVGSHGHGGLAGIFLGSVSHALLHHAEAPLCIVRPLPEPGA